MRTLTEGECPTCKGTGVLVEVKEGQAYKLGDFYDSQVVGAITETHIYFSNWNSGEASAWSRLTIADFRSLVKGVDRSRALFS